MPKIHEMKISNKVRALWGFPDGHVDIVVTVSIPIFPDPEVTLRIEPEEIRIVRDIAHEAEAWLKKIRGEGK